MHYKNGREAKNGDKVVLLPGLGTPYAATPVVGILYDATPGQDYCNGKLAITAPSDPCPSLQDCLHLDDALKLVSDGLLNRAQSKQPESTE